MDDKTIWEDLGVKHHECGIIDVDNIDCHKQKCPLPKPSDNYNRLKNKPSINGTVLEGDMTIKEDANYVHKQTTAADTWVIIHKLEKYPSVTVFDSAGEQVVGDVIYDSINQVTLKFKGEFKGTATLN